MTPAAKEHGGDKVRNLGAYEAIFARAQRGNFVMFASFAGTAPAGTWKSAVAALTKRHPMLRVRMQEAAGIISLVPAEEGNLRLWHEQRGEGEDWKEIAGRWLAGRIGIDSEELVRVLVLEGNSGCDLLLAMHHGLGDGRSALGLFEDLMRSMDGLELNSYELGPDVDQLLRDKLGPLPDLSEAPLAESRYTPFLPYAEPWAPLQTAKLNVEDTARLARRARAEATTVTGALAAAMVRAWRKTNPELQDEAVRLLLPVDVRSRVGLSGELMLAISTTNETVLPEQSEQFWELARRMRNATSQALTDEGLLRTAAGRAAGIRATRGKQDLDALSEKHLAWDLLVSNLGRWEPEYQGRTLRLTDVWGPAALYGFEGERGLGTITFAGELRLLLASREPAPGLLEAIYQELREGMLGTDLIAVPQRPHTASGDSLRLRDQETKENSVGT